jgi:hypothetical protein
VCLKCWTQAPMCQHRPKTFSRERSNMDWRIWLCWSTRHSLCTTYSDNALLGFRKPRWV